MSPKWLSDMDWRTGATGLAVGGAVVLSFGLTDPGPRTLSPAPEPAVPHATRPPLGHTGGFGEPTCLVCHTEFSLNPDGGRLEVSGFPSRYRAGRSYRLTVAIDAEGMENGGFEATIRFATGAQRGAQAGVVRPLDERVIVTDSLGVAYLHHSPDGLRTVDPDRIAWSFEWDAPVGPDAVELHVSANSANGDNSPLGDWIFALERRAALR